MYCESVIPAGILAIAICYFGFPAGAGKELTVVSGLMIMVVATIQLFMAFGLHYSTAYPRHMVRPLADNGIIWGGLLVPLVLFAKNCNELNAFNLWLASVAMAWSFTFALLSKRWWILGIAGMGVLGYTSSPKHTLLMVVGPGAQHIIMHKIIHWMPRSFTVGETAVIAQGLVLMTIDLVTRRNSVSDDQSMYLLILEAAGLCLTLTIVILRQMCSISILLMPILGTVLLVALIARVNVISWAINAVLNEPINYIIVGYWGIIFAGGLVFYNRYWQSTSSKLVLHLKRKAFHILAVLLFVPGFINPPLLHLGFTVALVLFVWVEAIRVLAIEPGASSINQFMSQFTDSRDAGSIITSHFYLLLGCALPVWIGSSSVVASLAGVLALGIADTAASLVGISFGAA
ncbi:dolichol kinase [Coemansia sp. RSA 1250]|nr:dolichol kinase [Coemansia sp. RSA 1250]